MNPDGCSQEGLLMCSVLTNPLYPNKILGGRQGVTSAHLAGKRLFQQHLCFCQSNSHSTETNMFEARLIQGSVLKKVVDAIKDLVNDANFDCDPTAFSLQAMDSSHVALVAVRLNADGFEHYRCDR